MICPKCKAEYRASFKICSDCHVPLIDQVPAEIKKEPIEAVIYKELVSTRNPQDVAFIKSLLEKDQIIYYCHNEFFSSLRPLVEPVRIMVDEREFENASKLIEGLELANVFPEYDETLEPKIHSEEKSELKSKNWNKLPFVLLFILFVLLSSLLYFQYSSKNDYNAAMSIGMYQYDTKNYSQAVDEFSKAIAEKPDNLEAYIWRAASYSERLEYELAIEDLNRAKGLNPDDVNIYIGLGYAHLHQVQLNKSLSNFEHVLQLKKDDVNGYIGKAKVLEHKGEYKEALKFLTIAENYEKSNLDIAEERSWILYLQGELNGSLVEIEKLNKSERHDAYRIYLKVLLYKELEKMTELNEIFDVGEHYYNSGTSHLPSDLINKTYLAQMYCDTDRKLEDALKIAEELIKIKEDAVTLRLLGKAYLKNGQPSEAIKYLEKAIEKNPYDTRWALGLAYKENKNLTKAKKVWKEGLKVNPHDRFILSELSKI